MIPVDQITEWSNTSPWSDARDVEQDLIICRALVAIYSDPVLSNKLAFRGGTAIHDTTGRFFCANITHKTRPRVLLYIQPQNRL